MQIRRHIWAIVVGVLLTLVGIFAGVGKSKSPIDTPTAFSLEPIQRNAGAPAMQSATSPVVEPKGPQWPNCSLPMLDDSDRDTFIARAKQWTPDCRMQAVKKMCSPHCIYGDEYMTIIESAANVSEGKTLLGVVLVNNEVELKHARVMLTDAKKFAAYAKTIVPHSSITVGGRECLERMERDHVRLNNMRQEADKRFARFVVAYALVHATLCSTCSEESKRERECKWMHDELSKGELLLRDAEKELTELRKLMTRN